MDGERIEPLRAKAAEAAGAWNDAARHAEGGDAKGYAFQRAWQDDDEWSRLAMIALVVT